MICLKSKLKVTTLALFSCFILYGSFSSAAGNDFGLEDYDYYKKHIEDFKTSDWFNYWKDGKWENGKPYFTEEEKPQMSALAYYVRVNGDIDLSKITTTVSDSNPDNVNRVIRIMPKEKFEKTFPRSTQETPVNGIIPKNYFSYLNFLKAVAVMPGYCGDYHDFPKKYFTKDMDDPDKIAKRFLATTFAHAVQETSDSGTAAGGDFKSKIPGTFAAIKETGETDYRPKDDVFGPQGKFADLTEGNDYYGRGIKQLTYAPNYANTSLLLYGDLRLLKYPKLIEEENILGFLTAIAYTLTPKSSQPSLAEVMDGSWHERLTASNPPNDFYDIYDREFPLTVLLVNGDPECGGPHKINITNDKDERAPKDIELGKKNTKVRIDAYNYFSTEDALLDEHIHYYTETGDGYDSCMEMRPGFINDIRPQSNSWDKLFMRPYYFCFEAPDWRGGYGPVSWDTGIQVFGGKVVRVFEPHN